MSTKSKNKPLEEGLIGEGYFRFHERAFDHDGVVIDLGCLNWNWSAPFSGKKEVVGFDPLEKNCPSWATLRNEIVSVSDGTIELNMPIDNKSAKQAASAISRDGISESVDLIKSISVNTLLNEFPKISVLKMNIEMAEYPLLVSAVHPIADQLVVSFHDNSWTKSKTYPHSLTKMIIQYLSEWYHPIETYRSCGWWVFLKK